MCFYDSYEKLAVVVHVLQTTHNLAIPRCCFVEDGKEMYQELKRTCIAIVLLIKAFVFWRSRCRCRRVLSKVPIASHRTSLQQKPVGRFEKKQPTKWYTMFKGTGIVSLSAIHSSHFWVLENFHSTSEFSFEGNEAGHLIEIELTIDFHSNLKL